VLLRGQTGITLFTFSSANVPFISFYTSTTGGFNGQGIWWYHTTDSIVAIGDYDGNGLDSFMIRSDWGSALIAQVGNALRTETMVQFACDPDGTACHGGLFGSWLSRSTDDPLVSLRFGAREAILMQSFND
jgi:hypothetical protein